MLVSLVVLGLLASASAQVNLLHGPLLTGATSFTFIVSTSTVVKPSPCYVTSGEVSQCRRRRGIEELPIIKEVEKIAPSEVVGIEPTRAPRMFRPRFEADTIFSSFDDTYHNTLNLYRQLGSMKGRRNMITVGDCGMQTVNFSQFLSCLGLTVQETTTLTATFTKTITSTSGVTTMTVGGCTPSGFPYITCSKHEELLEAEGSTDSATGGDALPPTVEGTVAPIPSKVV